MINLDLLNDILEKTAFTPPGGGAAPDPAMMGGAPMPPMDPAAMMGGAPMPPMDPAAMMGGAPMPPMDPAAMMGGAPMPPMDPAAMMGGAPMPPGAGPMPGDVGALGEDPAAAAPPTVGEMPQDDLKMMIADTVNEVLQGGPTDPLLEQAPEEAPIDPAPEGMMAEEAIPGEAPVEGGDVEARLDEMEKTIAALTAEQGIMPADAPQMEAPMDIGTEVPASPIIPPEIPKIASEDVEREKLHDYLKLLNIEE